MMRTLYSDGQGEGIIFKDREELNAFIKPVAITLNGETLTPGIKYDWGGLFAMEIEYLGLGEKDNEMILLLGSEEDMFAKNIYTKVIYKISETRIYIQFSHRGGRDFNFMGGKWK